MRTVGPEEDRFLLSALAGGDMSALDALYEKYGALIYHFLILHTRTREDAEDVLQEAFLSLIERGRGVTSIRNVKAYLLRVALNKASHLHRRAAPVPLSERDVDLVDLDDPGPEGVFRSVDVRDALEQLPLAQCEVVILKVWHELTFAEIAEVLDVSINTAASRYRYGLEKLQQTLGGANGK